MMVLLANWEIVLLAISLILLAIFKLKQFLTTPSAKRQELMLMWLIHAVELAEKEFGSKTGKLKLSYVYKMFVGKYGFLGMFVSQVVFENLVDKALEIMKETLQEEQDKELPKK